jgi:hypothetical protein
MASRRRRRKKTRTRIGNRRNGGLETKQRSAASQKWGDQVARYLTVGTMLLLAAFAPAGFAQRGEPATRSVQGAVTNADDSAANGAVVYLKNVKTLQVRSFITKEDGIYHFYELSPDVDYELKAEFRGASAGPKTLSSFDSKKLATINLKLNKK